MLNFKKAYHGFILVLFLISIRANAQKFLIPQTAMVQRAGSIGYNSFGVGYNLFRNQKGSLDLTWGYVPKSKGGRQDIFAAKFAYRPVNIKLREWGVLNLANPGLSYPTTLEESSILLLTKSSIRRDITGGRPQLGYIYL